MAQEVVVIDGGGLRKFVVIRTEVLQRDVGF
jgi:hypothetical protein